MSHKRAGPRGSCLVVAFFFAAAKRCAGWVHEDGTGKDSKEFDWIMLEGLRMSAGFVDGEEELEERYIVCERTGRATRGTTVAATTSASLRQDRRTRSQGDVIRILSTEQREVAALDAGGSRETAAGLGFRVQKLVRWFGGLND
ncbi:hypothetical protein BKA70DRAFT_1410553 [Coprinopsis sp. MPI-PUGE-AT-0042]|nr:hypothetical protein BKA70DRAFT_1410553 [Coprinopsis sp. MPI-PUGE-AT-0042]